MSSKWNKFLRIKTEKCGWKNLLHWRRRHRAPNKKSAVRQTAAQRREQIHLQVRYHIPHSRWVFFVWFCFLKNCFCQANTLNGGNSAAWMTDESQELNSLEQQPIHTHTHGKISWHFPVSVPTCIDQLAWVRLWSCNQTYPMKKSHPDITPCDTWPAHLLHLLATTPLGYWFHCRLTDALRRAAAKGEWCRRCRPDCGSGERRGIILLCLSRHHRGSLSQWDDSGAIMGDWSAGRWESAALWRRVDDKTITF